LILCLAISVFIFGCATAPVAEHFVTYNINGVTYFSLASLCQQRNISWHYDSFSKTVELEKANHKINLRVGDALALVDGRAEYLQHPVDIYQGAIVVPYRFKERIVDVVFKQQYTTGKQGGPITNIRRVVIDAGHGGYDPGTIGKTGIREKTVNLDVAKRLAKLLKDDGIDVILTRNSDTFIALNRRVSIANNANADLFISIHSNANRVRSLNGLEVYYVSTRGADLRRAMASAEDESLDFSSNCFASRSSELKATLWDMIYTYNRGESVQLAKDICKTIDRDLDTRVIGVKSAGFQVLRSTQMPAILIEIGFLSNASEERLLKNGYYRQQIAESIERGIRNYAQTNATNGG